MLCNLWGCRPGVVIMVLGADEFVHQAEIERPLHTEGPAEGPATLRLLQAPGVGVQVSTSSRQRPA
jgi:hypothetical protein